MNKILKYSSLVVVFTIILLLVIPFFIPLDKYKEMATKNVKEATGRELEINGAISLSLLPNPEITIQDIKLSSVVGAHNSSLIEAKELKVSISLLSLLRGNIVISSIKLNQPVINLERLQNGVASWEFSQEPNIKLAKDSNEPSVTKAEKSELYINSLIMSEAKINYVETYNAGHNSSTFTIDNLEIKNFYGPDNLACEFYSKGNGYSIKGEVKEDKGSVAINAKLDANLNSLKEKMNVSGNFDRNNMSFVGKLQLEGDAASVRAILPALGSDVNLDHKLTFDINANKNLVKITDIDMIIGELSVTGNSHYSIDKNEAGLKLKLNPGNIDIILSPSSVVGKGLKEKISIEASALKPIFDALKINSKDLPDAILSKTLSFSTDLLYLDQNLFLKDISLIIDKANLSGDLGLKNWSQDLTVSYDLKTNNLAAFAKLFGVSLPVNVDDMHVKGETIKAQDQFETNSVINVAKTTNVLKGSAIIGETIKPSLTLLSSGNNLGQSLGILLKSSSNTMIGNYSLPLKINGDSKNIIEITIDKSSFVLNNNPLNINGLLSLNLSNAKPTISANLAIPSLNLGNSSNVASSNNSNVKGRSASNNSHWPNDKIDLSFLNTVDGDMTIAVQKMIKGDLVFDNIKAVLLLSNGVLNIKSLNGNLYGGKLEASGQISSQNNQSALFKARLEGADLKNIASQGGKIKVTEGKVNFNADLKTKGQSQYQYVSNLFGSTKLKAFNGKISGFDLQKMIDSLKKIKSLDSALGMLNSSFSGGETAFKELEINTDIKEGIATITQFKLDVPSVNVMAKGNINLPQYSLDVNSTIKVDIESMPEIKVNLYGSLDNPQHKLDTRALQQHLIKNVLTNVVDEIKKGGKPEDILKNILGGRGNSGGAPEGSQNSQEAQPQEAAPQETEPTEEGNPAKDLESQIQKGLKGLFK